MAVIGGAEISGGAVRPPSSAVHGGGRRAVLVFSPPIFSVAVLLLLFFLLTGRGGGRQREGGAMNSGGFLLRGSSAEVYMSGTSRSSPMSSGRLPWRKWPESLEMTPLFNKRRLLLSFFQKLTSFLSDGCGGEGEEVSSVVLAAVQRRQHVSSFRSNYPSGDSGTPLVWWSSTISGAPWRRSLTTDFVHELHKYACGVLPGAALLRLPPLTRGRSDESDGRPIFSFGAGENPTAVGLFCSPRLLPPPAGAVVAQIGGSDWVSSSVMQQWCWEAIFLSSISADDSRTTSKAKTWPILKPAKGPNIYSTSSVRPLSRPVADSIVSTEATGFVLASKLDDGFVDFRLGGGERGPDYISRSFSRVFSTYIRDLCFYSEFMRSFVITCTSNAWI